MEIFKPYHGLLKDLSSDAFPSELFYFSHNDHNWFRLITALRQRLGT